MDINIITEDTNLFDNLKNRPEKPTSQEIVDIITPKPQGVVADTAWTIYSPNERQIGMWQQMVDGVLKERPLYEKTINFGALPNTTSKAVAHGISNLNKVVSFEGYADYTNGFVFIPLPFPNSDAQYSISINVNETSVNIITGSDRSVWNGFVTIQYTKSTDTWQTVE